MNPYALRRRNLNRSDRETSEDYRDVTSAPGDDGRPSDAPQPLPAAASLETELRELVSELRAVVSDLRSDNRRLREQLGERTAVVTDIFAGRK